MGVYYYFACSRIAAFTLHKIQSVFEKTSLDVLLALDSKTIKTTIFLMIRTNATVSAA